MCERELALAGQRRESRATDEASVLQSLEGGGDVVAITLSKLGNGAVPEDLADDGCISQGGLVLSWQGIHPGRDDGLH